VWALSLTKAWEYIDSIWWYKMICINIWNICKKFTYYLVFFFFFQIKIINHFLRWSY
jgi:hypothetical protein